MVEKMKKKIERILSRDKREDIGYILWKLESYEDFFPLYQSIIKKQ